MNIEHYLVDNKIDKLIKKALSDDELKSILGKDAKIILYPDLKKHNSIDELLPRPNDFCIILLVEDQNKYQIEGHWCALLKYDGLFEWFDPYGEPVDFDLIHWLDKTTRIRLHENKKYLTYLLKDRIVIHNKIKYEKLRRGVNTCGSHVAYRIYNFLKKNMTLEQYQKHMADLSKNFGLSYDKLVAAFVSNYIK